MLSIIPIFLLSYCVSSRCIRHHQKAMTDIDGLITMPTIIETQSYSSTPTSIISPSANPPIQEKRVFSPPNKAVIIQRPTSPPPETVGPSIPPGTSQWGLECLEEHNLRRASSETLDRKSLVPLVWDQSLSQSAKSWADQLAYQNNGLTHSKLGNGENLYSTTDRGSSCKAAVDAWFNEYPLYYNQKIGGAGFNGYGHFTQLVWPETTKIGCAFSDNASNRYVVCHYDPA